MRFWDAEPLDTTPIGADYDFGRSSSPWWSPDSDVASPPNDLRFLVRYMVEEMNTNAHSPFVANLARLNDFSPDDCIEVGKLPREIQGMLVALDLKDLLAQCAGKHLDNRKLAMIAWARKVKTGADWDHKPIIKDRFHSSVSNTNRRHRFGDHVYDHDIWSNIHYGYVGMAAGFAEWELVLGAAVAHTWDELIRSGSLEKWPDIILKKIENNPLPTTWDDPKDRVAIEVGIRLYRTRPDRVTVGNLMDRVHVRHRRLAIERYDPQRHRRF